MRGLSKLKTLGKDKWKSSFNTCKVVCNKFGRVLKTCV
jgi:hypothetical protein